MMRTCGAQHRDDIVSNFTQGSDDILIMVGSLAVGRDDLFGQNALLVRLAGQTLPMKMPRSHAILVV